MIISALFIPKRKITTRIALYFILVLLLLIIVMGEGDFTKGSLRYINEVKSNPINHLVYFVIG